MKKKNTALVFGITENYTFALANTLMGLIENNKKFWDDIIIYCDQMSKENMDNINKIVPCKFIDAKEMGFEKKVPHDTLEKYSIASFYRYDCFNLLSEYKNIIWNDVDILIQGDISGLLNYGDNGIALTKNIGNFKVEANFTKLIMEYDMFKQLFNSGIIVFKDTLPDYDKLCDWCINKTIELAEYLRWPDQGILNIMLQEFNITPDEIDINKYCCHPTTSTRIIDAKIIHAYGDNKFWNSYDLRKKFPKWVEYDNRWKLIEGNQNVNLPLVSCVMSTYNRFDYLKKSVESILNQTYPNIELIVVTEKCENQDKICKILESYKDNRIKIINNREKLGFSESLNVGIEAATGEYIARMDDDDISLPNRFELQVNFMESHKEIGICGTNAKFFGKVNTIIGVESDPEILKINTLFRTPFIHPTVMMRKEFIKKYNLRYNKNYFTEDYELWSRAIEKFPIANIDTILLLYRTGNDQMTGGRNENKIHESHKRIMRNQFENYLHLSPNENEIELLQGRNDVLNNCYNLQEAIDVKKNFIKKIVENNENYEFYNQKKLIEVFNYIVKDKSSIKFKLKRILKKIIVFFIKPFYSRLMNKVDHRIEISEQNTRYYCEQKIREIENHNQMEK